MIELFREAQRFQHFLEQHTWPFCFIGGIAVQHWGEPRVTRDLDVTVFTGFSNEVPVVDVALGALAFEREMVARSVVVEFQPGVALRICSAEDLMVLKAFAYRLQDRADLVGIARRQGATLAWDAVLDRLTPLAEAKGDAEIMPAVRALRVEFAR